MPRAATYVNNGLRVSASEQGVLDAALANRIIEFESGKAALTPSGMAILDQMSEALKKLGGMKVEVIGHTDGLGTDEVNQPLSEERAEAVLSATGSAVALCPQFGTHANPANAR